MFQLVLIGSVFGAACTDVDPGSNLGETDDDGEAGAADDDGTGGGSSDDSKDPVMGGAKSTGGESVVDSTGGVLDSSSGGKSSEFDFAALERCSYASTLSGMGGAAGVSDVFVSAHPFLGEYLTDSSGYALYTYGADRPGTCEVEPATGCTESCAIAWPPFHAQGDMAGDGLDLSEFGEFMRPDGSPQTTYRGWPLYYYKKDLAPEEVNGQGKGKIWHAATPRDIEVKILRDDEDNKFLVDAYGFTFYTLADDVVGSVENEPVSSCTKACKDSFVPYRGTHLTIDTSLDSDDFQSFTSPGVGRQVAYQGRPLYSYVGDESPFERNGVGEFGAEIVVLTEL